EGGPDRCGPDDRLPGCPQVRAGPRPDRRQLRFSGPLRRRSGRQPAGQPGRGRRLQLSRLHVHGDPGPNGVPVGRPRPDLDDRGPGERLQPGDFRRPHLPLRDRLRQDPGRVGGGGGAGVRPDRPRPRHPGADVASPGIEPDPGQRRRGAARRRLRGGRALPDRQPTGGAAALPVRLPSPVLPRRRLQPGPGPAVVPGDPLPDLPPPLRRRSHPRRLLRRHRRGTARRPRPARAQPAGRRRPLRALPDRGHRGLRAGGAEPL
ncbi:MAG: hypothetical protein AVDCRST_MAG19-8, partial [uncultured Thermomicrobiales bacterium]